MHEAGPAEEARLDHSRVSWFIGTLGGPKHQRLGPNNDLDWRALIMALRWKRAKLSFHQTIPDDAVDLIQLTEKTGDKGITRAAIKFRRCACLNHLAIAHHHDPIGHKHRLFGIMRHH